MGYTERLATSEAGVSNRDSSRKWRSSSLWYSGTVAEFASVGVEAVVVDSVLEGVGKPGFGERRRRLGRGGQA